MTKLTVFLDDDKEYGRLISMLDTSTLKDVYDIEAFPKAVIFICQHKAFADTVRSSIISYLNTYKFKGTLLIEESIKFKGK
jgi:hypothetical protein